MQVTAGLQAAILEMVELDDSVQAFAGGRGCWVLLAERE